MGSSWRKLSTPIGWIQLEVSEGFLTKLDFLGEEPKDKGHSIDDPKDEEILEKTANQLDQYFQKKIQRFDLPLNPQGTIFQQRIWKILQEIPYGHTWTYKELAVAYGDVLAIRAVGKANGANPIPIIIPCHRVIGANGHLTGYSGGLERKIALLALEGSTLF